MRVALAEREYRDDGAEERFHARCGALAAVARDRKHFQQLCREDRELLELFIGMAAAKVWRDGVVSDGNDATIEDDGSVRWTIPGPRPSGAATGRPSPRAGHVRAEQSTKARG
jgi:hypothetical protein